MNTLLTEVDRGHLAQALQLADAGRGRVSPNPLVGAVLVRDGELIGEGYHAEVGGLHAERAALSDCRRRGHDARGATMFVTLEPCAHQGRQPPCTEAILAAGIARVVIASEDPSEKASGRGPGILRDGGVEVEFADGEQARAARLINQPFRKYARTGLPLVTLKLAISMDGRASSAAGDSPWISGEQSRALVHRWRSESDAVAIGIGTALADDPLLSAREIPDARQPSRVVFDSRARLPLDCQLLRTLDRSPLILIVSAGAETGSLRAAGAEVVVAEGVSEALSALAGRGITSLLLEGGPTLAGAFVAAAQIDQARTFLAPILIGGLDPPAQSAPAPAGSGPARLIPLQASSEAVGADTLISAIFKEW